ncbi:hypothetical protein DCC26_01040 [Auritidibacter sp. NML120779]|nr:hypothetical protein DCC26_01040 [Auritidibacter sp. NML120779]
MVNDNHLTFESMSIGDQLGPISYHIDHSVHDSFLHSALAPASVEAVLEAEGDSGVAHPMQSLTDYLGLIEQTYAPMGTGLHTRHESTVLRPIPLDTPLTASGKVIDKFVKRDRDYWVAEYEIQDNTGPLVRHRMTATIDRTPPQQEATPPNREKPQRTTERQHGNTQSTDLTWTTHAEHTVDMEMIIDYDRQYWLRRGNDYRNPPNAHTSREIARSAGLPDAVAHSSHYYTWLANIALEIFGPHWLSGGRLEARFIAPVFPGNTLQLQSHRESQHSLQLRVISSDDKVIAVGSCHLGETNEPDTR